MVRFIAALRNLGSQAGGMFFEHSFPVIEKVPKGCNLFSWLSMVKPDEGGGGGLI